MNNSFMVIYLVFVLKIIFSAGVSLKEKLALLSSIRYTNEISIILCKYIILLTCFVFSENMTQELYTQVYNYKKFYFYRNEKL